MKKLVFALLCISLLSVSYADDNVGDAKDQLLFEGNKLFSNFNFTIYNFIDGNGNTTNYKVAGNNDSIIITTENHHGSEVPYTLLNNNGYNPIEYYDSWLHPSIKSNYNFAFYGSLSFTYNNANYICDNIALAQFNLKVSYHNLNVWTFGTNGINGKPGVSMISGGGSDSMSILCSDNNSNSTPFTIDNSSDIGNGDNSFNIY